MRFISPAFQYSESFAKAQLKGKTERHSLDKDPICPDSYLQRVPPLRPTIEQGATARNIRLLKPQKRLDHQAVGIG